MVQQLVAQYCAQLERLLVRQLVPARPAPRRRKLRTPKLRSVPLPTPEKVVLGEKERAFIFAVAMRYLKEPEEALEATQDAMLLAWRHREKFRGDSRLTTWLYRIAATTSLMRLRKRRRSPILTSLDHELEHGTEIKTEPVDPGMDPEARAMLGEEIDQIEQSLAGLTPRYHEIFKLRFAHGMSELEIHRCTGENVSTIKTRAHRARWHVRGRRRVT